MSNHNGSYMLNEVLLLEEYDFFNSLTQKEIIDFTNSIVITYHEKI